MNGLPVGAASESRNALKSLIDSARDNCSQREVALVARLRRGLIGAPTLRLRGRGIPSREPRLGDRSDEPSDERERPRDRRGRRGPDCGERTWPRDNRTCPAGADRLVLEIAADVVARAVTDAYRSVGFFFSVFATMVSRSPRS